MRKISPYKIGKIYHILSENDDFIYPEKLNHHTDWVDYKEPFILLGINYSRYGYSAKVLTGKGFVLNILIDNDTEFLEEIKTENQ